MSKASFSPLGQWRGKTGGQVYRVRNGEQIVASYQPSVANPRSEAQLIQRARFNLMTGLNSITPIEVLRGFAGSKSQKRAAYSKALIPFITAEWVAGEEGGDGKYVATINPNNIRFDNLRDSYMNEGLLHGTSIGDNDGKCQVVFPSTFMNSLPEGSILRIIDVYGPSGRPVSVNYVEMNPEVGDSVEFSGTGRHRIYAQLIVPTSTLTGATGDVPHNQQLVNMPIVSELGQASSASYLIGASVYIGSHVVPEE